MSFLDTYWNKETLVTNCFISPGAAIMTLSQQAP